MSAIKLTYFDMNGGRGEPIRLVLSIGGLRFDDHRISFQEFGQMRDGLPLGAVPIVDIDGVTYTQSNAMLRYYGRLTDCYPEDSLEAFKCDEIMGATEDMINHVVKTFGLEGDAMVQARQKLCEGMLARYLKLLGVRLQAAGGEYFADQRLTVADLKVFVQVKTFVHGVLDHVPTDLVANTAPLVLEHMNRIANHPSVLAYYASIET